MRKRGDQRFSPKGVKFSRYTTERGFGALKIHRTRTRLRDRKMRCHGPTVKMSRYWPPDRASREPEKETMAARQWDRSVAEDPTVFVQPVVCYRRRRDDDRAKCGFFYLILSETIHRFHNDVCFVFREHFLMHLTLSKSFIPATF